MVAIGRDVALTLIGLGGILHQELSGQVKPELLILYGTILGIPGITNLVGLARASTPAPSHSAAGTAPSSSPSPAPASPPPSS